MTLARVVGETIALCVLPPEPFFHGERRGRLEGRAPSAEQTATSDSRPHEFPAGRVALG
jgi:hypothetical protein